MQRLLTNLVDNAFKYAAPNPHAPAEVTIQSGHCGDIIQLSVLDRGPGIPQAEAQRLLLPFTRLDRCRADRAGSGLGLAIADRIARNHGGRVELRPRPGGGLEVRVELNVC